MVISEADTCSKYITPILTSAVWTEEQISREKTITDGKIQVFENKCRRRKQKRADYIRWYPEGKF